MLAPGDPAPDFTLHDQQGTPVSLGDCRGRWTVLCTDVLGVSTDSEERLAGFATEHGLEFPLLSDSDHAVAEA